MLAADAATGDDVKITQEVEGDAFRMDDAEHRHDERSQADISTGAPMDLEPASESFDLGDNRVHELDDAGNSKLARPLGAGNRATIAAIGVAPQPVENVSLHQSAAPSTKPVLSLVQPSGTKVQEASTPSLHLKPLHQCGTSAAPVSPLDSLPVPVRQNLVPTEWRTTWKTTSKDVRAIWKRLYVFDGGKWRRATRQDRVDGKIPDIVINAEVESFTLSEAARIERLGEDAIRKSIEFKLNRGRAVGLSPTGLRRTA